MKKKLLQVNVPNEIFKKYQKLLKKPGTKDFLEDRKGRRGAGWFALLSFGLERGFRSVSRDIDLWNLGNEAEQ